MQPLHWTGDASTSALAMAETLVRSGGLISCTGSSCTASRLASLPLGSWTLVASHRGMGMLDCLTLCVLLCVVVCAFLVACS